MFEGKCIEKCGFLSDVKETLKSNTGIYISRNNRGKLFRYILYQENRTKTVD